MAGYKLPTQGDSEIGLYVPGVPVTTAEIMVDHGQANIILGTKFSQLVLVFVEPQHRRQGIGNQLLDQVHAWADQHHRHLWLTPTQIGDGPTETVLTLWYEHRGWVPSEINGEAILARMWEPT